MNWDRRTLNWTSFFLFDAIKLVWIMWQLISEWCAQNSYFWMAIDVQWQDKIQLNWYNHPFRFKWSKCPERKRTHMRIINKIIYTRYILGIEAETRITLNHLDWNIGSCPMSRVQQNLFSFRESMLKFMKNWNKTPTGNQVFIYWFSVGSIFLR